MNGIALYPIAYKEYIDISYKLDIPPSPSVCMYKMHRFLSQKLFI